MLHRGPVALIVGFKWLYLMPVPRVFLRLKALSMYYGWVGSLLINLFLEDYWIQVAEIVCCGNHEFTDMVRSTWLNEMNTNAVAGTMVSGVTITAFTVDPVMSHSSIKWCWVLSLVLSLLTVSIATNRVRRLGRLLRSDDTLRWIRVKKDVVTGRTWHPKRHAQDYGVEAEYGYVLLPSFAACMLLSSSKICLNFSLVTLLSGFGALVWFWWREPGKPPQYTGSAFGGKIIFITFTILMVLLVATILHISVLHASEQENEDTRDRLIENLYTKRQQHLDAQHCTSNQEWIAWRKQMKMAAQLQHGHHEPDNHHEGYVRKYSVALLRKLSGPAMGKHDIEGGLSSEPSIEKPKRSLSRFPLFGAINDERVTFGQWLTTIWRRPRKESHSVSHSVTSRYETGSRAGSWSNSVHNIHPSAAVPIAVTTQCSTLPQTHATESILANNSPTSVSPRWKTDNESRAVSELCRELARLADKLAAHVEGQGGQRT